MAERTSNSRNRKQDSRSRGARVRKCMQIGTVMRKNGGGCAPVYIKKIVLPLPLDSQHKRLRIFYVGVNFSTEQATIEIDAGGVGRAYQPVRSRAFYWLCSLRVARMRESRSAGRERSPTSAPLANNSWTAARCPPSAARCNGLSPTHFGDG